MRFLLVFLGGGAGSLLRYTLGTAIQQRFPSGFPWGTVTVNLTGCFLIGLLLTLITERFGNNTDLRLLLIVGVLGGYTTFSGFEYETYAAARQGKAWIGAANIAASIVLGYLAVVIGAALARRLN